MKNLVLVLSLLGVVGLQAAAPKVETIITDSDVMSSLSSKTTLTPREKVARDRAKEFEIMLDDGSIHTESKWSLEAKYNLMFALVERGSSSVYKHDKGHMQAILTHGGGAEKIVALAKEVHGYSQKRVFNVDTFDYEKSPFVLNYEFLKSFEIEEPNPSGFEVL